MLGKLHLICMKTFAKIRCNLNSISYLSETQKKYVQSYNYNFFSYSFSKLFLIMFSLKLRFQ